MDGSNFNVYYILRCSLSRLKGVRMILSTYTVRKCRHFSAFQLRIKIVRSTLLSPSTGIILYRKFVRQVGRLGLPAFIRKEILKAAAEIQSQVFGRLLRR